MARQAIVSVIIQPGQASPAQKILYRRFWSKMIGKVKDELNDTHENPKS